MDRGTFKNLMKGQVDMPSLHDRNVEASNPPKLVLDLAAAPFENRSAGPHSDDEGDATLLPLKAALDGTIEDIKSGRGGARPGAGRPKGGASSPTTSEGRAKRKAERVHAIDWSVEHMIRAWDKSVTIDDGAVESFGYSEGHGWRRLATGTLRDRADDALRKQKGRPTVADRNEVLASWRIRTTPTCLDEIVHDTENRSWDLETGKPVPGVPWRNVIVHVELDGTLTATPVTRDVFHRRASIAAEYLGRVEAPPAYFAQALTDWGITDEDEVGYVGALIGLCLAEIPEPHGMLMLFGVGGSGKSTFIRIVEGLAGGAATATTPAAVAGRFGTWALQDHRLLTITDAANDNDPDTRRGLATIKALTAGDKIRFEQKGGLVYSRSWPGRVIWASNFPGRWGSGAEDYEAWERRLLPIPMPNRLGGNKIADFADVVLDKERDELASWAVTALTDWVGKGEPIPARMREARTKLMQAGKSPATLFALMHIEAADPGDELPRAEVWSRYLAVAETEGWGVEARDLRAVSKAVTDRGKVLAQHFHAVRRRVKAVDPDTGQQGQPKEETFYRGIRLAPSDI